MSPPKSLKIEFFFEFYLKKWEKYLGNKLVVGGNVDFAVFATVDVVPLDILNVELPHILSLFTLNLALF